MIKFINYIIDKSSKKILLISSVIFIFFMAVVLPLVAMYTEDKIGTSISPDTSLIYTSDDLFEMAEMYGETGRDTYISLRFSFDIIWPVVYVVFLVVITGFLLRVLDIKNNLKYLLLLPIIGVVFDFLENISSVIVMHRYPTEAVFFANLAPIMTLSKWIFLAFSFITVIMLGILYIKKRFVIRGLSE